MMNNELTIRSVRRQLPQWLGFALLGIAVGAAVLAWMLFKTYSQQANMLRPALWLSVALLLPTAWVVYQAFTAGAKYLKQTSSLIDGLAASNNRLQALADRNNNELDLQQQMLLAFLKEGFSDTATRLALDLMNVQATGFWRIEPHQDRIVCQQVNAVDGFKPSFKKGDVLEEEGYPAFFQLIERGESVVYPLIEGIGGPAKLGNLQHYIENNLLKRLLIIPVKVENGITGLAWFEDRQPLGWTEHEYKQGQFVASMIRLELRKRLRESIIAELSDGIERLEHLRTSLPDGIGWFRLEEPCPHGMLAFEKERLVGKAKLEEINEGLMRLFKHKNELELLEMSMGELLPKEIMEAFIAAPNFQLSDYAWEMPAINGQRRHALVTLSGIQRNGALQSIWFWVRDISQFKQLQWESEEVLGNISSVVTNLDEQGRILKDSRAIALHGYDEAHRKGFHWVSFFHHKDTERLEKAMKEAKESQAPVWVADARMRKHDGQYAHADVRIAPASAFGAFIAECMPIDSRLKVEAEAIASKQFMQSIVESGSMAVCVLEKDGGISFVTENFGKIFGHAAEERMGRYGFEYFHTDHTAALLGAFERIVEGVSTTHKQEAQFMHKNTTWRRAQVSLDVLIASDGSLRGVVMRLEDTTRMKQAAEVIKNREDLLESFIAHTHKAFVLIGEKGVIRFATEHIAQMMGFGASELLGKSLLGFAKPDDQEALQKAIAQGAGHHRIFINVKHKNGTWKHISVGNHGKATHEAYKGWVISLEMPLESSVADAQLELKADFFMALANALPYPILFANGAWEAKFGNKALKDWLGYMPDGDMANFLDKPSMKRLQAVGGAGTDGIGENQRLALRMRDKAGAFWQGHAHVLALKGSVLQGTAIAWEVPSGQLKEMEAELQKHKQDAKSLESKLKDAQWQLQQWQQQVEKQKAQHEQGAQSFMMQVAQAQAESEKLRKALSAKNLEVAVFQQRLAQAERLRMQAPQIAQRWGELQELLERYEECRYAPSVQAKFEEIAHFKMQTDFDRAWADIKDFMRALQAQEEKA